MTTKELLAAQSHLSVCFRLFAPKFWEVARLMNAIFTARKRSLGQGNIFRSACQEFCPRGRGVLVSQHALQVSRGVGGGYPSMPCRSAGPHPRGKLRGLAWGGSPGPHPGGKLMGLAWRGPLGPHLGGVARPTPRGVSRPAPGGGSPGPHLGVSSMQ